MWRNFTSSRALLIHSPTHHLCLNCPFSMANWDWANTKNANWCASPIPSSKSLTKSSPKAHFHVPPKFQFLIIKVAIPPPAFPHSSFSTKTAFWHRHACQGHHSFLNSPPFRPIRRRQNPCQCQFLRVNWHFQSLLTFKRANWPINFTRNKLFLPFFFPFCLFEGGGDWFLLSQF